MTGLEVEKERIIEVAVIVTDLDFNEIETYHSIVHQPQSFIDNMDEWNKKTHSASGLISRIPHGKSCEEVESDLLKLIERQFKTAERPIVAGNSIAQDRLFIDKYMKRLSGRLHYRSLDVTSWKIIMKEKFGFKHQKQNKHQALDDIRESIDELKAYLNFVHVDEQS